MNLSASTASEKDSKEVVRICTVLRAEGHVEHLHRGVLFRAGTAVLLTHTSSSVTYRYAFFGLFQAIFMATPVARGITPKKSSKLTSAKKPPNSTRPPSLAIPLAIRSKTPHQSR